MRKGQLLPVGIQMWTCPPPDYRSGHGAGQPRAEAITSHELSSLLCSMRGSLAPCQLQSAGTAPRKPEMFTACPPVFVFLWPFTLLFPSLLGLFTLFVAVHPLLSCLPNRKKKTTHLISHISLIPTLLRPSLGDPYWLNTQLSLGWNDSPRHASIISDE